MANNILVTTAISYPNSSPHIGHMYEAIITDIINRLYKGLGQNSKLLTGTDEHGKKIEETAKINNITPKELCDHNTEAFKKMLNVTEVNYDRFIRTTDDDHIQLVKELINKCSNMIYKSKYKGYYNIREESFVSKNEASLTDFKDPITGNNYEIKEEDAYMFKLTEFKNIITEILIRVDGFDIKEIENRLINIHDLTITRNKSDFTWGIDFPLDNDHIIYVWFDALINYITGFNSLFKNEKCYKIHVIGKDIVWFHSVIYPAILTACELPLYNQIYVHGHILDSNGRKMSKSLGNVISPDELLNEYPIEFIRFYFFSENICGNDIKFNKSIIEELGVKILINGFLNLFQRVYKLISDIPYPFTDEPCIRLFTGLIIDGSRDQFYNELYKCNDMLTVNQPWKYSKEDKYDFFSKYFQDHFYNVMIVMASVIPNKTIELNSYLGMNLPDLPKTTYHYDPNYKSFKKNTCFKEMI
jgi:methionyl-tRNA synthetase